MGDARSFDSLNQTIVALRQKLDDVSSTLAARLGSHTHPVVPPADATTTSKGVLQLAGDLAGTAAAPTVPGLSGKASNSSPVITGPINGDSGSINFKIQGDPSASGWRFYWNGSVPTFVRNDTNTVVKNFIIDHPDDPSRYLVHTTTESPQNGVEYWGTAIITAGQAQVSLPGYFESLCSPDNRQVQVSVVLPDDGPGVSAGPDDECDARPFEPEHATIPYAAASTPRNGAFRIACSGVDGTRVAWLVKAVRRDVPPLLVEPLRSEVEVFGDGPYRYYRPRP